MTEFLISPTNKKFFSLSEIFLNVAKLDKKQIAELSGMSRKTVSDSLELMMDVGIIDGSEEKRPAHYRLFSSLVFAVIVFTQNSARLDVYKGAVHAGYREFLFDDRYFYDENVSFAVKSFSGCIGNMTDLPVTVCAVICPDGASDYKGTKSILADEERLKRLISLDFGTSLVLVGESAYFACGYASGQVKDGERCAVITDFTGPLTCAAVGYGFEKPSATVVPSVRTVEKIVSLLKADKILIDKDCLGEMKIPDGTEVIREADAVRKGALRLLLAAVVSDREERINKLKKEDMIWKNTR